MSNEQKVEALVRIRDGLRQASDALDDLAKLYVPENIMNDRSPKWNPEGMKWVDVQGEKGPYQKCEDVDNLDFKGMLKDLTTHKGKLYRNGLFYWTFPNGATVGRKQVKKT
jgi:hypothetical protein